MKFFSTLLLAIALHASRAVRIEDEEEGSLRYSVKKWQCGKVKAVAMKARYGDADAVSTLAKKCATCKRKCDGKVGKNWQGKCQRYADYCTEDTREVNGGEGVTEQTPRRGSGADCEDDDNAVYGANCDTQNPSDDCGTCSKLRSKSQDEIYEICGRIDSEAFANCKETCRNCGSGKRECAEYGEDDDDATFTSTFDSNGVRQQRQLTCEYMRSNMGRDEIYEICREIDSQAFKYCQDTCRNCKTYAD